MNKRTINQSLPPLPEELLEKRRKKNRKRIYVLISLIILITLTAVFFTDSLFPETVIFRGDVRYTHVKILFFVILYLLAFVFTGVPFKMLGETWSGTVKKVEITDGFGFMKTPGRSGIGRMYRQNTIALTVERDDGKIVIHPALSLSSPDDHTPSLSYEPYNFGEIDMHVDDYSVGDRVYKYRGFEHLCIYSKTGVRTCIVCGQINPKDAERCWDCDERLVKDNTCFANDVE